MPIKWSGRAPAMVCAATLAAIAALIPVYRLQNVSWLHAIGAAVTFVLTCVLLGWAVWHILMRRGDAGSPGRGLARHVLTGLAFSMAWTICFSGFVFLVRPETSVIGFMRAGLVWQFIWGVF